MSLFSLVLTVAASIAFGIVAVAVGDAVLQVLKGLLPSTVDVPRERNWSLEYFGISTLTGFGACASFGALAGLAHLFYSEVLAVAAVGIVTLRAARLRTLARWSFLSLRRVRPTWPIIAVGTVLSGLVLAAYQQALAPPAEWDALAYHLPEARVIVETHRLLPIHVGGDYVFPNLPKLGELLLAEGFVFHGAALAQALQVCLLFAFALFAFGWMRLTYGIGAAVTAVAVILQYDDLVKNASGGLVDTTATVFEASAVICLIEWLRRNDALYLLTASVMVGFALSTKYSAAFTFMFMLVVVAAVILRGPDRRQAARIGVMSCAVVLLTSGIWYLRNALLLANPTYPLLFGHRHMSDAAYRGFVDAVRQFRGPRTISGFFGIPRRFADLSQVPVFVCLVSFVFGWRVQIEHMATRILIAYVVGFCTWWYFIASHQPRFLAPAVVVAILVTSAFIFRGPNLGWLAAAAMVAALLLIANPAFISQARATFSTVVKAKIGVASLRYVVGAEDSATYLTVGKGFGCEFGVIAFLQSQKGHEAVIDNWPGVDDWHVPLANYYSVQHSFRGYLPKQGEFTVPSDFRWYYLEPGLRSRITASGAPTSVRRLAFERRVLSQSKLVWNGVGRGDICRLYRLPAKI